MTTITNIHIWSSNIIFLMFIIASVGYILRDKKLPDLTSSLLFKFYYILITIIVISGIYLLAKNYDIFTHSIYWIKIVMSIILVVLSVSHYFYKRINPTLFIIIYIMIYSISIIVGSNNNV